MNEFLITNISGIFIGILSAIIASYMYETFQQRRYRQPLDDILNFGRKEEIIFAFPSRTDCPTNPNDIHILPTTSTEDFLAVNNIKSALLKIHWEGKDSVRQPEHMIKDVDYSKTIFCICSTKSNTFTAEVEDKIIPSVIDGKVFRVQPKKSIDEYEIWDGISATDSPTYEQIKLHSAKSVLPLSQGHFDDYAYITKITNPWNASAKIFIIAGIRGIGTWGAAECLKKNWKQIHDRLDKDKKKHNFSALIKVTYENLDIIHTKVVRVNSLPTISESNV
jgi:hypothetical protein